MAKWLIANVVTFFFKLLKLWAESFPITIGQISLREIVGGKMTWLQRALLFSKLFNQLQNIKFERLAIYCTASRYK